MLPGVPTSQRDLSRRALLGALGLLAAVFLLVAWKAAPIGNIHTGDTDLLVAGADRANDCIADGTFSECQLLNPTYSDVGPYPLLQYLPASALQALGASPETTIRTLARISWVSVVAMVLATLVLFRRPEDSRRRVVGLLVVALGPLWFYATSAFGEALAAVVAVAMIAACRSRRWPLVVVTVFLAGITKETMPPVAAVLAVAVTFRPGDRWLPPWRTLVPIAGASAAAVVANSLFNVFRYGSISNLLYNDPLLRVPGLGQALKDYVMIWFSPNAGVVAFWPLLAVPAVVLGVAARRAGRARDVPRLLRVLATLVVPVLAFVGFAIWFSPFGWIAWGPRLQIPLLPAWALAALVVSGRDDLDRVVRPFVARPAPAVATGGVLVLLAVFVIAAPWSHVRAVERLIAADTSCGRMTEVTIQADPDEYYRCIWHYGFRSPGHVHAETLDADAKAGVLAQVLMAGVAVALVVALRGETTATAPERSPDRRAGSTPDPEPSLPVPG